MDQLSKSKAFCRSHAVEAGNVPAAAARFRTAITGQSQQDRARLRAQPVGRITRGPVVFTVTTVPAEAEGVRHESARDSLDELDVAGFVSSASMARHDLPAACRRIDMPMAFGMSARAQAAQRHHACATAEPRACAEIAVAVGRRPAWS